MFSLGSKFEKPSDLTPEEKDKILANEYKGWFKKALEQIKQSDPAIKNKTLFLLANHPALQLLNSNNYHNLLNQMRITASRALMKLPVESDGLAVLLNK